MFMGFIKHFYIIFGTNLLTGGPVQIAVFLPISVFRRKGISNGMKPWESYFWNKRNPGDLECTSRSNRGSHEAGRRPRGCPARSLQVGAPTLVGPSSIHRPTSSSYIYLRTLKPSKSTTKNYFHHHNLLYPRDPILEPLLALRRRGNQPQRASTSSPRPFR